MSENIHHPLPCVSDHTISMFKIFVINLNFKVVVKTTEEQCLFTLSAYKVIGL